MLAPRALRSAGRTAWQQFATPTILVAMIRFHDSSVASANEKYSRTAALLMSASNLPNSVSVRTTASLICSRLDTSALIGRMCGPEHCGSAFLVGSDTTICPSPGLDDHLELWINRRVDRRGRLGGFLPVTTDMFELQTHRGEYRLEISRASEDACRQAAR